MSFIHMQFKWYSTEGVSCLYGEVKVPQQVRGGGGEEEADIYEVADLELPVGEDDGDYEN